MNLRSRASKARMSQSKGNGKNSQIPLPRMNDVVGDHTPGLEIGAGERPADSSLTREEFIAIQRMSPKQDVASAVPIETIDMAKIEMLDRARAELDRFKNEMQPQIMTMVARALPTPPARNGTLPNVAEPTSRQDQSAEDNFMNYARDRQSVDSMFRRPRSFVDEERNQNERGRAPPIHEWGIVFDGIGSNLDVDDFVFRVEHLQRYHRIQWIEIIGQFHKLLKGKAADWYWTYLKMNCIPDWATLRNALFKTFSSNLSNFDLERQLIERKQKPNEPIDDYIHEMNNLRSRLKRYMPENDMIKILKRNVQENVGKVLYPMFIRSVEQFRAEFHTVQNTFGTKNTFRNQANQYVNRYPHRVNELSACEEETLQPNGIVQSAVHQQVPFMQPTYPVVEEISNDRGRQVISWNCKTAGHTYFDCEQPRTIFCYRCGLPDTISPKCPRCQENIHRGLFQARPTSSQIIPPN